MDGGLVKFKELVELLFNLKQRPVAIDLSLQKIIFLYTGFLIKIRFSEIAYIEGLKDYVKIHLQKGKPVITRINLKDLTKRLPVGDSMRIHRFFIVSLDKIEAV